MKVRRRDMLRIGGGAMASMALSTMLKGCGNGQPEASGEVESGEGNSNGNTLTMVQGSGFPNSLDIHRVGTNRPAYGVSWALYDRLMTFGSTTLEDGTESYDFTTLEPELAEGWEMADDEMSVTFFLRQDATFHDGAPVTAADVKWSFDRAILVGGFPAFQMKAGALEDPDQFEVVDDHTFRVKFIRPDKLTMMDLAVPVPVIINSELVKPHITEDDPWGAEWVNNHDAGGGAYKLGEFRPNERITLVRFEDWKSGSLPAMENVILLNVPEAGNRRALLERGDIDINFDLTERDTQELGEMDRFQIVSTPIENCTYSLDMHARPDLNGAANPLADARVRQAIAYSVPYDDIMATAFYSQAVPLFGADSIEPSTPDWPQPHPYTKDLDQARELLAEAGYPDGFDTTIAFDLGNQAWAEPMVVLVQESLAEVGINATIERVPSANFRSVLVEKSRPIIVNPFGGWLNYPDYFFFYAYHGQDATFNGGSYSNPEMDELIDNALATAPGEGNYEEYVKGFIQMAWEEMPRVPIVQPVLSAAMQPNVNGYRYWFHRQVDFRTIEKA